MSIIKPVEACLSTHTGTAHSSHSHTQNESKDMKTFSSTMVKAGVGKTEKKNVKPQLDIT